MAKKTDEVAAATDVAVVATRNPADPIGNPPGGGKWTWDIEKQAWVELPMNPEETN